MPNTFTSEKQYQLFLTVALSALLPSWYAMHSTHAIVKQVAEFLHRWLAGSNRDEQTKWINSQVSDLDGCYRFYKATGKEPDKCPGGNPWHDKECLLWSLMLSADFSDFQVNYSAIQSLEQQVETASWNDRDYRDYVREFANALVQGAAIARSSRPDSERALLNLAHHLGQLVQDPAFARQQEEERQQSLRKRYVTATANLRLIRSAHAPEHWSEDAAAKSIAGAEADARLTNEIVRQLVAEYGLLDRLKKIFPRLHTSFGEFAANVFTETHWPLWWAWAEPNFFHN